MKTSEMIQEELLEFYKLKVAELQGQNEKLKAQLSHMERNYKHNPHGKWYMDYLREANASLAYEVDHRQHIINQYQTHYAKFGHFYADFVEKHKESFPQAIVEN
jgi:hypothetical protein